MISHFVSLMYTCFVGQVEAATILEDTSNETATSELDSSFETVEANMSREDDDYAHSPEDARDQGAALMNKTAQVAVQPILMEDPAATAGAMARIQQQMQVPSLPAMNGHVSVTETAIAPARAAAAEPAAEASQPTAFQAQLQNIVSNDNCPGLKFHIHCTY